MSPSDDDATHLPTGSFSDCGERRADEAPPERVGRYVVSGKLGEGGMGIVLEAHDPELHRPVAIKLLHPGQSGSAHARLLREAQAMAKLSHPNVVQVYDVGVDGDRVYIAMELVRGTTLKGKLHTNPSAQAVLDLFVAAGQGLAAAHDVGLIHRDFKPENVLVGDDGRVRVADFGLAGARRSSNEEGVETVENRHLDTTLTAPGAILGTPRYMAPEQHAGLPVTARSDQFSFCVALHEAVYGVPPFSGSSMMELATKVLLGHYERPRPDKPVPRWLASAIRRGLELKPHDRHPSMHDLLRLLVRGPVRRRRRILGAVGAVALASSAVAAANLTVDRTCDAAGQAIARDWSAQAKSRFNVDDRTGVWRAAVGSLDAFADDWSKSATLTCHKHRNGEMSVDNFEAATQCLERGRAALLGLVSDVAAASNPSRVASAAASLPHPLRCTDPQWLALEIKPPNDNTREVVAELGGRLAQAEVKHQLGRIAETLDELTIMAAQAKEIGYEPLEARVALVRGRLAIERNDSVATVHFAAARDLGLSSGADGIAAEAMARLVFAQATHPTGLEPRFESLAWALTNRVGAPPALAALLTNNLGVAASLSGRHEDAQRAFIKAIALAEQSQDINPVDYSGYIENLAIVTKDPERRNELYAQALDLRREVLGAMHPSTLDLEQTRALSTIDVTLAIDRLALTCDGWSRHDDAFVTSECFWELAVLQDAHGDAESALVALTHAGEHAIAAQRDNEMAARRAKIDGFVAWLRGDAAGALQHLDVARKGLADTDMAQFERDVELAHVDVLRARILEREDDRDSLDLESVERAIAVLERELARGDHVVYRVVRDRAIRLVRGPAAPTSLRGALGSH